MRRVLVLNQEQKPLMPCHPARARELLKKKKAKVYRQYPFTIILMETTGSETQTVELKIDPGSKTTGIVLVGEFPTGDRVIWAAETNHRGDKIREALASRRALRRSRRNRKTRYRAARFDNRKRLVGWLPPSLKSRVDNVYLWADRLIRYVPVTEIALESVKFDTQKLLNPEISGVEYQQGTLAGYEVREYLLEKFNRTCVYCGRRNISLEIDHVKARSNGGTDRVGNLVLACNDCNQAKGNRDIQEYVKDRNKLERILKQLSMPLKDAAAINSIRYAIGNRLKELGLPVTFWSGGRTKFNRVSQGYEKKHWIDAACVGESGVKVYLDYLMKPLVITATGRGSRQMCRVDKYGFPRTGAKQAKRVNGFQTGDLGVLRQPGGKYAGVHRGIIVVRSRGDFDILTVLEEKKKKITASWKNFKLIQHQDGYSYSA